MPIVPKRGGPRQLRDISLGRIETAELPGIAQGTTLAQLDKIVQSGAKLGNVLLERQEKKKKENDDLAVNEAYLAFQASSGQSENEFNQIKAIDSEGMFSKWKTAQDENWKQASKNLTGDQRQSFDQLAGRYGLQQNARIAIRETTLHEQRIDDNFQASSAAASLNAFKEITRPTLFYENINEARRLNKTFLERQGLNETDIKTKDTLYFSKSVKEAIIMTSSLSLLRAEAWYEKALKDEELTTQDSLLVRSALDKRNKANDEETLLTWAQDQTDKLIQVHGENREAIFSQIEEQASGKKEVVLKKEANVRLIQIKEQKAEDQRAFRQDGKIIIDQSPNATEARKRVSFIMADHKTTIDTANKLDAYIKDVFEKPAGRRITNPSKLDELYTNINKTLAGIATPDEIISSPSDIDVRYGPHLSIPDRKAANDYLRNGGFFGKTAYNDLLQSFANMKETTVDKVRRDKETLTEFTAYLNYARPLLPPDKVVSPIELQRIAADFYIAGKAEGRTPRSGEFVTFFDALNDETYREAVQRGEGLIWLPYVDDDEETKKEAEQLIIEENAVRAIDLRPPYLNTEKNRSRIYKQKVMLLPTEGIQ